MFEASLITFRASRSSPDSCDPADKRRLALGVLIIRCGACHFKSAFHLMLLNTLPALAQETETAQRLQERDPAVLAELFDLYGRLTYSRILRIVHEPGIAEDLVQETFLAVWRRAGSFDSQRGVAVPWLLAIARNRALDYLRWARHRRNRGGGNLDSTPDPKALADLERTVSIACTSAALSDALGKLSVNQRAVIDLAYFEGFSQTEIAVRLGHPLGTVKTWVRDALRTLRVELQERSASQTAGALRHGC